MIRFGIATALAVLRLTFTLSVEPTTYHVEFPPNPENSSVVLVISSESPARPYVAYNEVPILEDYQSSIDFPRHALPKGSYHITAMLMRWRDNTEVAVDSADTIILID